MLDLDHALSVAISAARAAGEVLKSRFGKAHIIRTKHSPRDLVTEVDRSAQEVIVKMIQKAFPDHRFLTEESGTETLGNPRSPYVWVIDPLDGTTNFVHGKPLCGTNIALLDASTPLSMTPHTLLGVMWNPFSENLFTAKRGSGAFWNNRRIVLRKTRDMNDATLCCNVSERAVDCQGEKHVKIPVCGSIQNYGCAMEEVAAVLRAENDGVFFDGVGLWDIAPGFLMIEETGGKSRIEFRNPADPRKGVRAVASTASIFGALSTWLFEENKQSTPIY